MKKTTKDNKFRTNRILKASKKTTKYIFSLLHTGSKKEHFPSLYPENHSVVLKMKKLKLGTNALTPSVLRRKGAGGITTKLVSSSGRKEVNPRYNTGTKTGEHL